MYSVVSVVNPLKISIYYSLIWFGDAFGGIPPMVLELPVLLLLGVSGTLPPSSELGGQLLPASDLSLSVRTKTMAGGTNERKTLPLLLNTTKISYCCVTCL